MNLERLDRIVIKNQEEVERLLRWRDENKDLVRHCKPVLREGLIQYRDNDIVIHFKQQENEVFVRYESFFNNIAIAKILILRNSDGTYAVASEWFHHTIPSDKYMEYIQDMVTVHMTLMAYMEHHVEYVDSRRESKTVTKKAKHGDKKNKNRSVKIGRKVYIVDVPEDVTSEKRKYERHTETWKQRGFWRHYKKSGKVTWINEQVKGDKTKNPAPKDYRI